MACIMFTKFYGYISFIKGETKHVLLFLASFFILSHAVGQSSNLFDSDEILEFTLQGDLKALFKDRGDAPQYHVAALHYQADQNTIKIPIKIKTRGHFRKISSNCKYPPILLNFSKLSTPKSSVFEDLDKVYTTTHANNQVGFIIFPVFPAAKLRKHLFLRFFSNRTGIKQ